MSRQREGVRGWPTPDWRGHGAPALLIAYHLLTEGTIYLDPGGNYFDERDRDAVERRRVHRLQGLCDRVALEPGA